MMRFPKKPAAWLVVPFAVLGAQLADPATAMAAPTRSFAAAKDGLASDTEVLASANLKVARSTRLFSLVSTLLASDREVKTGLDAIKKTCGIDPMNAIDDVTVGVDSHDKGGIYVGLTGVTEDQLTKCVISLAKAKSGEVVTSKKIGNEIEFTKGKSANKLYVAWLANNVLFIASDPEDETLLKKETGGGLAKSQKMSARLGKTDTDATAFFAWTREQAIQNVTQHGGTASIAYAASSFAVKVSVDLGDANSAETLAKGASAALSMIIPRNAPKEAQKIAKSVQVKAQGTEVTVALQVAEDDLEKVITWASKQ